MDDNMRKSHRIQHDVTILSIRHIYRSYMKDLYFNAAATAVTTEKAQAIRAEASINDRMFAANKDRMSTLRASLNSEQVKLFNILHDAFVPYFSSAREVAIKAPVDERVGVYNEVVNEDFNLFMSRVGNMLVNSLLSKASETSKTTLRKVAIISSEMVVTENPRVDKLISYLEEYRKDFFNYMPCFFNPVSDELLVTIPIVMLKPVMVTCLISGKEVPKEKAYLTEEGTYIGHDVFDSNEENLKFEWNFCQLESGSHQKLYRKKNLVPVYNQENTYAYNNVLRSEAEKRFTWYEKTRRFYNFDITRAPCYILGSGWYSEKKAKELGATFEPNINAWLMGTEFRLLNHSDDVLSYLPGFRHLPTETTVMGSKNNSLNTLFMGMELEVEMSRKATINRNEAARQAILEMGGHAVCVSDGSLSNGFEVVSVPATLNYHYTMWERLLRGSLRKQIVSYMRPSCGIHIHLSKEAFTNLSLGKFITFINSPENTEFIDCIAQRGPNSYQARPETKPSSGKNRDVFVDKTGGRHGKYTSTNLSKEHTIEVRIFKGTLAYPQVMKNFEFCHALHKYVTNFASATQLHAADFINWLITKEGGNRKAYPYLYDFLRIHGYIEDKLKKAGSVTKEDITDEMAERGTEGEDNFSSIPKEKLERIRMANGAKDIRSKLTA